MKTILIISATSATNFHLAENIMKTINKNEKFNSEILNLENIKLPIFNPSTFKKNQKDNLELIVSLTDRILDSYAFVLCIPEYNGNTPPVFSNTIAWVSVTTNYWKDGFNNKNVLIGSSSGGTADKLQIALRNQMEHLGCIVFGKSIIVNSNNDFKSINAKNIINEFIKVL